jgi:hypothetical protein
MTPEGKQGPKTNHKRERYTPGNFEIAGELLNQPQRLLVSRPRQPVLPQRPAARQQRQRLEEFPPEPSEMTVRKKV